MILVMASTGMFGRPVVEGLAKRGLPVRATGRSEKGLATLDAPGAELIPADMDDPSSLLKLMNGVDKVLVNAPMDDQKEVREKNVIEAMIRSGNGAKIVLLTGGVLHDDALGAAGLATEKLMRSSGLPWTVVGPQTVMETNFKPFRELIQSESMLMSCVGAAKVGFVALDNVTDAFIAVLESNNDAHVGCEYVITGPEAVTFDDVATAATEALDRRIIYQDMPRDEFRKLMVTEAGFSESDVDIEVMCHLDAFRAGKAARTTDDFTRLTGKKSKSVREWWIDNANYFLST
ncbi:nmrA-like family protein [Synechococcus sp. BIOS-E4-1]|nr:nmrA-like family protein [Synechococcus sp. BIOS-E4-1]